MKFHLILLLLFVSLVANVEAQTKYYCDREKSTIVYFMHHPLHEWEGVSKAVDSVILTDGEKLNVQAVAVQVKVASFDSKNSNRDSHMLEVTEALIYPTVTFTSESFKEDGDNLIADGTLTFHGVSKPISVPVQVKHIGDTLEVTGKFNIKLTDFNIDPPSLLGVATEDNITLNFDVFF
jgi:polyisoprenoid-binding protein YceI